MATEENSISDSLLIPTSWSRDAGRTQEQHGDFVLNFHIYSLNIQAALQA